MRISASLLVQWLALTVLCTCASASESQRLLVVATPKSAEYTQWRRDWCHGGVPAKSDFIEVCSDDSVSFGGEIHAVKLKRVTVVSGTMPSKVTSVAIAQHGMRVSRWDTTRWLLVLEPAPQDFAKATGLMYIARTYGVFSDGEACLHERLSEIPGLPDASSLAPSTGDSCYQLSTIMNLAGAHTDKALKRTRRE
jgi:hypothetical protein